MDSDPRLQILLTIYQEVACHLRATDENRDRLFDIYITIVLAVTSGLILLRLSHSPLPVEASTLALVLVVILLALGETVLFAMIGARKWHAEYVNCSIMLHAMMSREVFDARPDLVSSQQRHPFASAIHTSRAFVLVQVALVGTYLMAGNLLASLQIGMVAYAAAAMAALITVATNSVATHRILREAEGKFWENPTNSWVFSGLMFDSEETEG